MAFVVFGVQIASRRQRGAARNSVAGQATAMAWSLLISCSAMTKETFQTLSPQELATVGGGLGWLAKRLPLAAAGLRRIAFGPGANAGGGSVAGGCAGGGCSGGGCAG